MEQNKILNKPFKQIFHITDIKHNVIGIPFMSKYIPTIKDKYTKTKNTALTIFQRLNKQPPSFSKFYPIIIYHYQGIYIIFQKNKFTSMIKVKINNNFSCQTSNLNLFTNFSKLRSHP